MFTINKEGRALKARIFLQIAICMAVLAGGGGRAEEPTVLLSGPQPELQLLPGAKAKSFNLLDPQKLSFSHSYSISFSSDGRNNHYNGLYLNTIRYQFSQPLSLKLKWGFLQSPGTAFKKGSFLSKENIVIPGFELTYQPFKNVFFKIGYSNLYWQRPGPSSYLHSIE